MKRIPLLVVLYAIWLASGSALAAGPKKIKQPKTFPLVISTPGSYIFASDINVPDADTTAISIMTDDVTLDLNGFSILGPSDCSGFGAALTCAPTGMGNGISSSRKGITIRNGTIRGMGSLGIRLNGGVPSRIERVRVFSNGGGGIQSAGSLVDNTIEKNGGSGASGGGEVSGNVVLYNKVNGLFIFYGSITGNTVLGNGKDGITPESGALVSGNSVKGNQGDGISDGGGSMGLVVTGNSVNDNTGFALKCVVVPGAYSNNVFNGNNGGNANPQVANCLQMGTNMCGGDTTCP